MDLRPYRDSDAAIVCRSWKLGAADLSGCFDHFKSHDLPKEKRSTARGIYLEALNAEVPRLLTPETCVVGHNPRDDDAVWGFACGSNGVLHYVWVKDEYRGRGFARTLVAHLGLAAPLKTTTWTRACEAYQLKHPLYFVPSERRRVHGQL